MTANKLVALKTGWSLSATFTEIQLVVFVWLTNGRQTKMPLAEFKAALVGAASRLQVKVCGGADGMSQCAAGGD